MRSGRQAWEYWSYETENPKDARANFLDRFGRDGWELVSVIGDAGITHTGGVTMFYFKRPL